MLSIDIVYLTTAQDQTQVNISASTVGLESIEQATAYLEVSAKLDWTTKSFLKGASHTAYV